MVSKSRMTRGHKQIARPVRCRSSVAAAFGIDGRKLSPKPTVIRGQLAKRRGPATAAEDKTGQEWQKTAEHHENDNCRGAHFRAFRVC